MTIDAQADRLKSVFGSDKYDLVARRPYSPPANVFLSCPLPVVDPQVVWNFFLLPTPQIVKAVISWLSAIN